MARLVGTKAFKWAWLICLSFLGCYTSHPNASAGDLAAPSQSSAAPDASVVGSGGSRASSSSTATAPAMSSSGTIPPGPPATSPVKAGGGGCPAILAPNASVTADGSAFKGIGGSGFELVGVCDRCGWAHDSKACNSLVYSVPTYDNPRYEPCFMPAIGFVDCLQSTSCICDGDVPEGCQMIKSVLDDCVSGHAGLN